MGIMLTRTEQVWRHLADGAHHGCRRWSSMSALAADLGFGTSTVAAALEEPRTVGAVAVAHGAPLTVLDPWKLLVLWAARRGLAADILEDRMVGATATTIETTARPGRAVLGGHGAIVARLGRNTIADYTTVMFYGEPDLPTLPAENAATRLLTVEPDPLLARYGDTTTIGQSWVDLFRTPGWQAAEFTTALLPLVSAGHHDTLLQA